MYLAPWLLFPSVTLVDAVLPAHVQFTLLPEILNDRGVRAEVASDPDLMTIRFPA